MYKGLKIYHRLFNKAMYNKEQWNHIFNSLKEQKKSPINPEFYTQQKYHSENEGKMKVK